jgi:hypothetical protein
MTSELRVPPATERELVTELSVVVDLAVEDHDEAAAPGNHGLCAEWRKVDDGEPPVRQRESGLFIDPTSLVIRTSVGECRGHPTRHASGVGLDP